jgi:hypothetical protein
MQLLAGNALLVIGIERTNYHCAMHMILFGVRYKDCCVWQPNTAGRCNHFMGGQLEKVPAT